NRVPPTKPAGCRSAVFPSLHLCDNRDGLAHNPDHCPQFCGRRAKRRHEDNNVAERTQEQARSASGLRDLRTDPLRKRIGLLRHAVSHQLDARDESNLTDITNMGMRPERLQQVAKDCNLRHEPLKGSLLLKDFEVRQGDRTAEWIAGIAVPMKERLELLMMSQKFVI